MHYTEENTQGGAKPSNPTLTEAHETGTVKTLFSQNGVNKAEFAIRWFWDWMYEVNAVAHLMQMLEEYTKAETLPQFSMKPAQMVNFVSDVIQLVDLLKDIVKDENVGGWDECAVGLHDTD